MSDPHPIEEPIEPAEAADPASEPATDAPQEAPASGPDTSAPEASAAPLPPFDLEKPKAVVSPASTPVASTTVGVDPEPQPTVIDPTPQPTLDLSLSPTYRGAPFVDISWNWPSVARAAIALSDYLIANPTRQTQPLLPSYISLDTEGQLQVGSVSANEAAPFTAPEIIESTAPREDKGKKGKKKGATKIVPETAAVYHVGAIAHYLLVGYPPIGDFTDIEQAAPATPDTLKDVLLRALAVDAEKRTTTLDELRKQLYFVLDPPAWFEKAIPKLPVDEELKTRLTDGLNRAQLSWYRLRDRIPWQRLDKMRKRYDAALADPRWGPVLRLSGVLLLVLIYLLLMTDVI